LVQRTTLLLIICVWNLEV